jgi:shikimate 5-dehydrogenase
MFFVGVSTGESSIMSLFPLWAAELGFDASIRGIDLPLGAPRSAYRDALRQITGEPCARGALVTTHKARMYESAADLFVALDSNAHLCREISCIAVRDGQAHGWAKDPITAQLALEHMIGTEWSAAAPPEALCLGAGGAGVAISAALFTMAGGPARVTLADRDPARIAIAEDVHDRLGSRARIEGHVVTGAADADRLVEALPPGSLVINATGLGKDLPGSPVSEKVRFPPKGVVWDLNYRGDLRFLDVARSQAASAHLHVFDGWRYFLHGWTEVIAEVFGVEMTPGVFESLARVAAPWAPAAGR